jgi:hypothetical protein
VTLLLRAAVSVLSSLQQQQRKHRMLAATASVCAVTLLPLPSAVYALLLCGCAVLLLYCCSLLLRTDGLASLALAIAVHALQSIARAQQQQCKLATVAVVLLLLQQSKQQLAV